MPLEYFIWEIAREFGWTLDYIDSLTIEQFHQYMQIRDARMKAQKR